MTRGELTEAYRYYSFPESLFVCGQTIGIYADFIYRVMRMSAGKPVLGVMDFEASVLLQMMWAKVLHLRKTLEGVVYTDWEKRRIEFLDHIVVGGQVRSIYEMSCMFHLVYRKPKTADERLILYNLWVHSGLAYRQKMIHDNSPAESIDKALKERQEMIDIRTKIEGCNLYQSLNFENKNRIKHLIKNKEYLMSFEENNEVKIYKWFDAPKSMPMREGAFEKMYAYFSQYAHPSNVSVFQFADMYGSKKKIEPSETSILLVNTGCMFLATFVADYISLYSEAREVYDELPVLNQLVIDSQNKMARGDSFSLSDLGLQTLGRIGADQDVQVTTPDGYRLGDIPE